MPCSISFLPKHYKYCVLLMYDAVSFLTGHHENLMVTGSSFAKKHTLEDLFRPPIDMTFKGSFLTVSLFYSFFVPSSPPLLPAQSVITVYSLQCCIAFGIHGYTYVYASHLENVFCWLILPHCVCLSEFIEIYCLLLLLVIIPVWWLTGRQAVLCD